jgi:thiamine biosynthesis lipoprotein
MGTVASLDIRGGRIDGLDAAIRSLHDADARFSTYRAGSEISQLARGELRIADASADVRAVLGRCERLRQQTGGFFDVRAGGGIDPSALVKGWAAQRAADLLVADGLTDFCLSVGGDVITRGDALPGRGWTVGVQHPHDRTAVAARIWATDLAIATSGAYERGLHIVDPHTGKPPADILSVTVVGPDLGSADAYSTAAFAMGADGPQWTLGLRGYEALTILTDGSVLRTPGFPLETA